MKSFVLIYFLILIWFSIIKLYPQIRIKAVGDVMLGSITPKTVLPVNNGEVFVDSISSYLKNSDIVFGNLEGTFITDSLPPVKCKEKSRKAGTCFEFGMPLNLAITLQKLGFNVLSLDNNHSQDYGIEGYTITKDTLRKLKIKTAGKKEFCILLTVSDSICVAAFGYSENSYRISDLATARSVIENLSKHYNLVIVSFHGGAEGKNATHVVDSTEIYLGEDRGNEIAFAHTVIDAGADLVIGHGPHVLRAFEIYKNKLIAYSLGNFLTYGNINISGVAGISGILDVSIESRNGNLEFGRFIPTKQIGRGIPVFDETKEGIELVKTHSDSDIPKSKLFVDSAGYFFDKYFSTLKPRSKLNPYLNQSDIISKSTTKNMRGQMLFK